MRRRLPPKRTRFEIAQGRLMKNQNAAEIKSGILMSSQKMSEIRWTGGDSATVPGGKKWTATVTIIAEDLYKAVYGDATTVAVQMVEVEVEFVVEMPVLKTWKGTAFFDPFDTLYRQGVVKIDLTCNGGFVEDR